MSCNSVTQYKTQCAEKAQWSTENLFQVFSYFSRPQLEHIPLIVGSRQLLYLLQRYFSTAPYRAFKHLNIRANSTGIQFRFAKFEGIEEPEVPFQFLKDHKSVLVGLVNLKLSPDFNQDDNLLLNQLICLNSYWKKSVLVVSLLEKPYDNYTSASKEKYEGLLDKILCSTNIMNSSTLAILMNLGKMGSSLHSYPLSLHARQLTFVCTDSLESLHQVAEYFCTKKTADHLKDVTVIFTKNSFSLFESFIDKIKMDFVKTISRFQSCLLCQLLEPTFELPLKEVVDNPVTQERLQICISKEPRHQQKNITSYIVKRYNLK